MGLMKFYLLSVVLLAVCVMASCISESVPDSGEVKLGSLLPQFRIQLNDGTRLTTDDLFGKPSVLVFFSTTCPDCQQELPVVEQLFKQYSDQIYLVCISRGEGDAVLSAFWKEHNLTMPYSAQETADVYHLFANTGVPRIYVSNADLIVKVMYDDANMPKLDDLTWVMASLLAN